MTHKTTQKYPSPIIVRCSTKKNIFHFGFTPTINKSIPKRLLLLTKKKLERVKSQLKKEDCFKDEKESKTPNHKYFYKKDPKKTSNCVHSEKLL